MSEYVRTTRECSVTHLQPELLQAIRNFFQERELGNLIADALLCCETISRKKTTATSDSWLSGTPDTTIHTGVVLTSQYLIWVHNGDRSGIRLNAARLSDIRAEFYIPLFTKDAGLEIVGYISDARSRVRGYIGMGPEPAAQKFCEAVKEATIKAKPPASKKIFGWPIG